MVEGTQAAHVYKEQGQNPSKVRDGPTWNQKSQRNEWISSRPKPFGDESRTIHSAFFNLHSDREIQRIGPEIKYKTWWWTSVLHMYSNLPLRSVKLNGEKIREAQMSKGTRPSACINMSDHVLQGSSRSQFWVPFWILHLRQLAHHQGLQNIHMWKCHRLRTAWGSSNTMKGCPLNIFQTP